jgi:AraC family transcriptional regulator
VLNHDQRYSITIEPERSVESFCVFFEPGLASGVLRAMSASAADLLDDPDAPGTAPEFFERTYRHDALLSPALFGLRDALPARAGDRGWLRERAHELVERMLELHCNARAEAARLAPARAATRHELYRRLHRGRDFIEAMYRSPITVDDAARAACLSASHFLRTFKDVFGLTPNAYLMRVRLDHARRLLEHTDLQVVEICERVGYSSPATFTRTFARACGIVPSKFRRSKR